MDRKDKIGIDARMIGMSGIGTYIQHLMGQGIYGYAVGKEEEIRRYDKDVRIIPFDAPIYGPKEQVFYPVGEIKRSGIKAMHFPHYNVPIKYRGEYIVTVHDLTHLILPAFLGSKMKYCYAKLLMSHAVGKAQHILTVSENSKKDIIRIFKAPKEKISVTYNAIDHDFGIRGKGQISYLYKKYRIPENKKLLLYVGNLKPHKNLKTALKALERLRNEGICLLLVGKDFQNARLQEEGEKLGIQDKVIYTGMVGKDELIDLYNLADLFVFPSLYEGFGIPPLEAMACGTPVIAADNSSIPEVVGDAAVLVDANDPLGISESIVRLLRNKSEYEELIRKGLQRARFFSWDKTVALTRDIIYKYI